MSKMVWNVYYHNFNSDKIEIYNIFDHCSFNNSAKKYLAECQTKEEFAEELKAELQYYFWSRSEWELIIEPWCVGRNISYIKVDVYDQVMNNWHIFVDYVWSCKE